MACLACFTALVAPTFAEERFGPSATHAVPLAARFDPTPRRITIVDADDIAFTRTSSDGLSQSRVGQIAQDDRGFMWFGTQYGLNRYDGYRYTVFAPDVHSGDRPKGVFVHALFKDKSGLLWIASDHGLDTFDPRKGSFSHVLYAQEALPAATINSIYQDRAGLIWLSTSGGLYRLDSDKDSPTRFRHAPGDPGSLSSNDVKSVGEDNRGTFWVATAAGLDVFDRASGRVSLRVPLRDTREIGFIEDRSGTFWVYRASGTGLAKLDRRTNTLTEYVLVDVDGHALPSVGIYTALEDREGQLWFGTGGAGLLRYDAQRQRFMRYRNNSGDAQSLGGDNVVALFQDLEGNIWVALHGLPLNLFPGRPRPFRKLPARPDAPFGRGEAIVNAIFEDRAQRLWISYVGTLLRADPANGERVDLSARLALTADVASIVEDDRGRVWLGTIGGGVVRVDPSGAIHRFLHDARDPASLSDNVVPQMLLDHVQTLWLATWGGLARFDEASGTFTTYRHAGSDVAPKYVAMTEDGANQLWLGTHANGLQRFDPATGEFLTYTATDGPGALTNNRVNAVHVDRIGILWVGTQNGLNALDPRSGKFTPYDMSSGLPGNVVSCILEDEQGALWMSTNNGIARLDPQTKAVRSFSQTEGLPGRDFTGWGSCYRSRRGEMFFGGYAGATAFRPGTMSSGTYVPPVVLTDLEVAGKPYLVGPGNSPPTALPEIHALTLPYAQNSLSLGFAALSYSSPTTNRYRFRLEGLESSWHQVGSDRRIATYTTLPAGNYRLEVQGATSGGPWSAGRLLELTILPPWWQTLPFRIAIGALLLSAGWFAYVYRLRRIARQFEIRLEERVAERTRIARELHDSLLQGFQGLMFRLQAVRNILPERPQEAAHALDEALDRGDQTVGQARAAVTDLRTFGAGESDLESALRQLVDGTQVPGTAQPPSCRVVVEGQPRSLVPLVRDEVLQVAREAFRNAIRHARPRLVEIEVNWGAERFSLRVRDDGVGLDPGLISHEREGHWGLRGMRERATQVGGSLNLWSESGAGTEIELTIPASHAYASSAHLHRTARGQPPAG